uniref:Uncharacterized protein n=1 Tax=Lactuca sativa TaxID=4236 RepID=A0A9R1WHL0_LACSA|nr:hypothetical protein LSAT_V11C100042890 [Lactuca sativa]
MATLSTLELMLHEIQNQENIGDHGGMPVLPQRPVSKARIPTRRTRRAILSFHLQEFGGKKKEEFVDGSPGLSKVKHKKSFFMNNEDEKEKSIIIIQKCFRGYLARLQYYKLTEGIITLQSFVRGENARREFKKWSKMPTQTHVNQEFVWKPLRNRETTIVYLQSVVRDWLSRRHPNYMQNASSENMNDANNLHNDNIENEEHISVSEPYIRDLQRQVLRTEAALRHKKRENSLLALQIQQIDSKWELHKAEMSLKEKTWQDEFTSIQMSLAATRERTKSEIIHFPQNPSRRHDNGKIDLTIRQILELQENDFSFRMHNIHNFEKCQKQELRKLKGRFKSWKKEFKARLQDVKKTINRFDEAGRTKKVHKRCWVA